MILLLSARKFPGSASAASRRDLNGLGDLLGKGGGGRRTVAVYTEPAVYSREGKLVVREI